MTCLLAFEFDTGSLCFFTQVKTMFARRLQHISGLLYHTQHEFSTSTLSTCIVGSGPSGFYTAKYLLKKIKDIRISIIDELPTPFGLVRYGVAPDHADTKNVINVCFINIEYNSLQQITIVVQFE